MHVNFYKRPQIKNPNTRLKIEKPVLFLDYLDYFISNLATKRVQGYGTVGLAHNTIHTYKSLFRIVKGYQFEKSEKLYVNSIDKYTAKSFTRFLKIEKQ
jgi:hypothetical protein